MRDRFMSGMLTGGIIGATAGLYAYSRMSPRQRKRMMKRGNKMLKNAVNMIGMTQSMDMFR
ncbi:YtxH domain-containing protein [Geosporobacter ferrireducens]|uniref:YtxH domain-containing protein n=1 Tax=Geosporobacter ferrireducens TaxID=1424294 RepID=A0A1D8GPG8_9FIRM|nr:YtxH domain-containing protein [Geosporobacter ferrireducens]AOT72856.1 hypothetical protein Gferi_26835 [Geosporobacter ferrireducens]MTI55257.1 YtxH domain-containing protein [Geosporobacter ferrireducens]